MAAEFIVLPLRPLGRGESYSIFEQRDGKITSAPAAGPFNREGLAERWLEVEAAGPEPIESPGTSFSIQFPTAPDNDTGRFILRIDGEFIGEYDSYGRARDVAASRGSTFLNY